MSPEEEQLMIVTSALKKSLDNFASLNSSYIALEAKLSESEQRVKTLEEALKEIRDYDPYKSPNEQLKEIYTAACKESDSCPDCARIRKANWPPSGLCSIHYGKVTRAREAVDRVFEHNQKYEPQNIARRALELK